MRRVLTLLLFFGSIAPVSALPPKLPLALFDREGDERAYRSLLEAISKQDENTVISLLRRGVNVNQPEENSWRTPLICAILAKSDSITRLLLEFGADVNQGGERVSYTPVCLAAREGSVEMVRMLLEKGAKPNVPEWQGLTPLMYAVQRGQKEMVRLLLAHGADANRKDPFGTTALMMAVAPVFTTSVTCEGPQYRAAFPHEEILKMLLAKGADLDGHNMTGYTAWMAALWTGRMQIASLLENAGASTEGRNEVLLARAVVNEDAETVERLLAEGADANACARNGDTALMIAVMRGNLPLVKTLLAKGANVNRPGKVSGRTPLIEAAALPEITRILLDNGADIRAGDKFGKPLLYFMTDGKSHPETVRMLLKRGLDANGQYEGWTWLMRAAKWGHAGAVSALLEAGADVHAKDAEGNTALHHAILNLHREDRANVRAILEALLKRGAKVNARNNEGITPYMLATDAKYNAQSTKEEIALLEEYKGM